MAVTIMVMSIAFCAPSFLLMYDAIDLGAYRRDGVIRIDREKFVENFIRRFAESATLNKTYTVNFYSIYEIPPAVSIEIKANTGEFNIGGNRENLSVTNRLTAILEVSPNGTLIPDET